MIIEIHGAGFENKGAELMLRTTVAELRKRIPYAKLAIDPTYGSYEKRAQLGLYQIFPYRTHVGTKRFRRFFRLQQWVNFLPVRYLRPYGIVPLQAVNAFLDISGFAYSDQWGTRATRNLAALTHYYAVRQRPVVLLPQALGPFHLQENQDNFRQVLKDATLVFARDAQSYEYARDLLPACSSLLQAPDITLFSTDQQPVKLEPKKDYVCVVPNERMLDQGQEAWKEKYENRLLAMIEVVTAQGLPVKLVIHDTSGGDRLIAERIHARLESDWIEIVEEQQPQLLKKFIGESYFIIGSRFHSLVAGLAQGVPTLCLGWAHKYEMLLQEFGVGSLLLKEDEDLQRSRAMVTRLLHEDTNAQYRRRIVDQLARLANENEEMWQRVLIELEPGKAIGD